jgi:hypothetical protein
MVGGSAPVAALNGVPIKSAAHPAAENPIFIVNLPGPAPFGTVVRGMTLTAHIRLFGCRPRHRGNTT